jgi:cytochrome P450
MTAIGQRLSQQGPDSGDAPSDAPSWHGFEAALRGTPLYDDPFPAIHHLRSIAPVHETPLGTWRLSRYADCVRLLREVRCGVRRRDGTLPRRSDEQGPAEFMLQQDPPNHTRLRKLVSKAFTPRAVESWRPRVRAIVDEQLGGAFEAGEMDVIAGLALPVPATLICELLGVPVADRDHFTVWTADATHGLAGNQAPPETQQRARDAAMGLAGYFTALIEDRRKHLTDDLLSVLIRAEEEGDRLSQTELIVQSIGLLIAGFETTIGLIGNGAAAFARHPAACETLRARPDLVPNAIDECLRFDGPIGMTVRVLHEDADFGGRRIPADTEVFAILWGANRDPEVFPDPDRFHIERSNAHDHLAFGGGTHFCLGSHLARMEAQEALGALVTRAPRLELLDERIAWGASLFRVPARLPMRLR